MNLFCYIEAKAGLFLLHRSKDRNLKKTGHMSHGEGGGSRGGRLALPFKEVNPHIDLRPRTPRGTMQNPYIHQWPLNLKYRQHTKFAPSSEFDAQHQG
jgi:hypothetical protein